MTGPKPQTHENFPTRARVVVIGGGVGGASTFYHLTTHGWNDVVLIERDEWASGTTWHSAGQVTQFGTVQTMVGLKKYSCELYSKLADDPDRPITYRSHDGGIRLGYDQQDLDGYHHFVGMAKGMGVDFEVLSPSEMAEVHPLLDVTGLAGGLWDPVDGDIDPTGLVVGLVHAGRQNGGQAFRHTDCVGLTQAGDGWAVHTNQGDIECESIVNAAGYRVHEVGGFYGLESAVSSMEHQYFLTAELPELQELGRRVPLLRDPGDDFYSRQEHHGLLVGIYEQGCKTWGRQHIPPDFTNKLEPPDLDRLEDNMMRVFDRLPVLQTAGISSVVNGPITYSGDGVPLVGRLPGRRNAYCMLGLRAGVGEGGGLGKVLAEIIVDGQSEWDTWVLDPRRFTEYADEAYASKKAVEEYRREFVFDHPDEHRPAGRNAKTTPLTEVLAAKGAEFGVINGWERTLYFHPAENDFEHVPSFRFSTYHDQVGAEARSVRSNVGVAEISGFTRFRVEGAGAIEWFDGLTAGRIPAVGRTSLAYVSDSQGRFLSEFTMTRLGDDSFWLLSAAAAEWHDLDVLADADPPDGVTITNLTHDHNALMVAGPNSRSVLGAITDAPLDNASFPWLAARTIEIEGFDVVALRLGFTGELGWELHMPMEASVPVYQAIHVAGARHGLVDFGLLATESMRLEKNYRAWKSDLHTEFTVLEARLDRFVNLDKEFQGRDAIIAQREAGHRRVFIAMEVDNDTAAAHLGDPILSGHKIVGVVTSGAYGHHTETNIATGYIDPAYCEPGTQLTLEVIGERSAATVRAEPMFDPEHLRPRADAAGIAQ
ncbi:MAG: FAD-dependent oxidoreductase [Acidimicrobiales bacterium]|nr:FAD-dependent oxidoreductase [Acidimicrobiales bacterium]